MLPRSFPVLTETTGPDFAVPAEAGACPHERAQASELNTNVLHEAVSCMNLLSRMLVFTSKIAHLDLRPLWHYGQRAAKWPTWKGPHEPANIERHQQIFMASPIPGGGVSHEGFT